MARMPEYLLSTCIDSLFPSTLASAGSECVCGAPRRPCLLRCFCIFIRAEDEDDDVRVVTLAPVLAVLILCDMLRALLFHFSARSIAAESLSCMSPASLVRSSSSSFDSFSNAFAFSSSNILLSAPDILSSSL